VKGFARGHGLVEARRRLAQLRDLPAVDRLDDRLACRKMPVERADSDLRPPDDLLEADVHPGASASSLMNTTPLAFSESTTNLLWTISCRT